LTRFNNSSIIYENENFVAINKEPGILTIPDRHDQASLSLYKILQTLYPEIYVMHRLDRETSGIILFAKNKSTHKFISQLFEKREITKLYLGMVVGSPLSGKGIIDEPIMEHPNRKGYMTINKNGKPSITEYKVLGNFGIYSWVQFTIHSGRTHQIRVHMKWAGHPIVCDSLYGDGKTVFLSSFKKKYHAGQKYETERPLLKRAALHAHQLIFRDISQIEYNLEAPLPRDLKALCNQLQKNISPQSNPNINLD
jgi:23S rRNA pseudouridine955/2504/2580 synthase